MTGVLQSDIDAYATSSLTLADTLGLRVCGDFRTDRGCARAHLVPLSRTLGELLGAQRKEPTEADLNRITLH